MMLLICHMYTVFAEVFIQIFGHGLFSVLYLKRHCQTQGHLGILLVIVKEFFNFAFYIEACAPL